MSRFQKWTVLGSSALVALTGLVYWWMDAFLRPVDPWAVVNHPLQPLVLKLHILAAPVMVFSVGLIALDHIWKHVRGSIRLARRSGLWATAVVAPMIVSGYLIQAVTHPVGLRAVVWTHLATGLVFTAALAIHHQIIRRRRRARECLDGARWGAPVSTSREPVRIGTEVATPGDTRPADRAGTEAVAHR